MAEIPQNVKDKVTEFRSDFSLHAKSCLRIRDHVSQRVLPFTLNDPQAILHLVAEKQKADTGIVRILFLKSRRFGGSTYVEGRFYSKTSLHKNRNTFIIGHEEDSTTTLYRMATLMHEQNPLAPATKRSNAKELVFDNDKGTGLKSEYRLAVAKNVDAARSQGIHYLHGSEEAFWPAHARDLLNGVLQCLPDPPAESEAFRESTANGYGNTFQEDVFKAYAEGKYPYYKARLKDVIKHMPDSDIEFVFAYHNPRWDWVLVFVPWFAIDRYTKEFETDEHRLEFAKEIDQKVFDADSMQWVDSEAKNLQKRYKLSLEQLYWRQWAIENKCSGSEDKFRQEYPSNIEEAFLSKGSNLFGKVLCDELEEHTETPVVIGQVVDRAGKSRVKKDPHGNFSLWDKPRSEEQYFITVDPGGGIKPSHEKDNTEPDPTCIDVWMRRTGKQVAQWHGHIDYDLIADIVYLIGRMFFVAPACVELMNHGYTVVSHLSKMHYPMFESKPNEPGFLTTKASKPKMVDDLLLMAKNYDIQIMCKETISEMRTFIEENGKYHAAQGCHDDRVMSAAMASQMMTLLPEKLRGMQQKTAGFGNMDHRIRPEHDHSYREVYVA